MIDRPNAGAVAPRPDPCSAVFVPGATGALVLLAALFAGAAQPAFCQTVGRPAAPGTMLPLARRLDLIEAQIRAVDDQIQILARRLPELQRTVDELIEELASAEAPIAEPKPKEETQSQPKQVAFRPPLVQLSAKRGIFFVCEDRRLSFCDIPTAARLIAQRRRSGLPRPKPGGTSKLMVTVPNGDYDVVAEIFTRGKTVYLQQRMVRKRGRRGQTIDEVLRPGSLCRRTIQRADPKTMRIDFTVFPDSFELFRAVRQLAWDAGFDVGWDPWTTGKPLRFGAGAGPGPTVD